MNIRKIMKNIRLIALDFDGVLTDNRALIMENGTEAVFVNRSDGLAINILKGKGYKFIIISTEKNIVVEQRANKLCIPVISGVSDKKNILLKYCNNEDINLKDVFFIGNDINDVEVMKISGKAGCPNDAYESVKKHADIILKTNGGMGVVRELLELMLENNCE